MTNKHREKPDFRMYLQSAIDAAGFHLTPLSEADEALFTQLYRDPVVMALIGPCLSAQQAQTFFAAVLAEHSKQQFYFWRITNEQQAVAGLAALVQRTADAVEMGMLLLPEFFNRGYSVPVLAGLIDFAFRCWPVQRILASHQPVNAAAPKLLRKLQFNYLSSDSQHDHWDFPRMKWQSLTGCAPYTNIKFKE